MTSIRPFRDPAYPRALAKEVLFAAGVISSLVYVAADLLCGLRYPGYSFVNQVISELSAIGAPTTALWGSMLRAYAVLFALFTVGVLVTAAGNRPLKRTGWLLLAFVLSGPLWTFFPMHTRGDAFTWQDMGHIGLGAVTVLLMTAVVHAGSATFDARFRRYSLATMATVFLTGAATFAYVVPMIHQSPTPGAGLIERVSLYAWLLWIGRLAVALRHQGGHWIAPHLRATPPGV